MKALNRIFTSLAVMSSLAIALPATAQPKAYKGLVETRDGKYRGQLSFYDVNYKEGSVSGKGSYYFQGEFNRVSVCHRANDEVTGTYTLDDAGEIKTIRFQFAEKSVLCGPIGFGMRREKETGDLIGEYRNSTARISPVVP